MAGAPRAVHVRVPGRRDPAPRPDRPGQRLPHEAGHARGARDGGPSRPRLLIGVRVENHRFVAAATKRSFSTLTPIRERASPALRPGVRAVRLHCVLKSTPPPPPRPPPAVLVLVARAPARGRRSSPP